MNSGVKRGVRRGEKGRRKRGRGRRREFTFFFIDGVNDT